MEEHRSERKSFDWKEFSQRTWVVVVSGLVFPPLGIFLSWRKTDWAPKAKWIATGLMGLLLLWRMGGSEKKEGQDPVDKAASHSETVQYASDGRSPEASPPTPPVAVAEEPAKDFQTLADRIEREKYARMQSEYEAERKKLMRPEPSLRERYNQGYQGGKSQGEQMRYNVGDAYRNDRALGEQHIRETEEVYKRHVQVTLDPRNARSKGDAEEARGRLEGFQEGSRK